MDSSAPESYRTLSREGRSDFVENKSRFMGYAAPALEEKDALAFIDSIRARHPDASAVLFAYVCGFSGAVQRYHDSHEPSGGLLMLEALKRQRVTGAVTAVTRWFGGVKLGAGPLGRAFGQAAAQAVADAAPCTVEKTVIYSVEFEYAQSGGLEHWFGQHPWRLLGMEYQEKIRTKVAVRSADAEAFRQGIADWTAGQADEPVVLDVCYQNWQSE